ncbi:MAG: type II toxin-antitoxin system PemK/MazF family toxin [Lachnospiraceae bacterium]|nr:type II toxin-antitoxin system PemK/MazF family toxin [Lachnospiraceae bacterium]
MAINIDLTKTQQYLDWMKEKLYLNSRASSARSRRVLRGQVYKCNLGMGVGSEECKERPCVILQYDSANSTSPNTIVAPITHSTSTISTVIPIADKKDASGITILDGNVLLGNIVCVSKARLGDYIVELAGDEMKKVDMAIATSLNLHHYYQTLSNEYNDKITYIEKLKGKRQELTEQLKEQQEVVDRVKEIMDAYKLSTVEELDKVLAEKYSSQ